MCEGGRNGDCTKHDTQVTHYIKGVPIRGIALSWSKKTGKKNSFL